MSMYLLKVFILLIFSVFVGYNFYFLFPNHILNFDGYLGYFIIAIPIYFIYKYIQLHAGKKEISISIKSIITLFLLNLFILCFYFFGISGGQMGNGFVLFFKIILYTILPLSLFLITTGFGNFLTEKVIKLEKIEKNTSWLLDLTLGFTTFITLLVIIGLCGFYNIYVVLGILAIFGIVSYKQIYQLLKSIWNIEFKFDNNNQSRIKLYITEFFYLIAFIALGIGLISIVRPFPIGWDDLGVYMNQPHLLAQNGSLLSLGGMYAWSVFTGIGFLFNSPTQAFFLNISGLIITFVILNVVLSNLLKTDKKSVLNIPIILSTIFISLPMVSFHSTKDLKVEEGLFFITIIVLFFVFKYFINIKEEKNSPIIYLFILGLIAGFCFSIKFTSLLLILGVLAVISYARLGINGFLGYIGVFFGVFTLGNFWSMMNVVINPNNIPFLERNLGIGLIIVGIIFLVIAFVKKRNITIRFVKEVSLLLLGVVLILSPWFIKNLIEISPNYSILGLLNGKSDHFYPDYSKIYSSEELTAITEKKEEENKMAIDEDLGRYLGYDNGILNHVDMFWNLTMQKNQGGDFTNIGFLFFALLPLIFIFLPYKNKYNFIFFVLLALAQVIFYAQSPTKYIDENKLNSIDEAVWQPLVVNNEKVFENKKFNKDIYDIDVFNYYSKAELLVAISEEESIREKATEMAQKDGNLSKYELYLNSLVSQEYSRYENDVNNTFYSELKEKVIDPSAGPSLEIFSVPLTDNDFTYVRYLNSKYTGEKYFAGSDIIDFKKLLIQNDVSEENQKELISLWKNSRTISGKIRDILAGVNMPLGYVYLFLGFILPTLYLLCTLKKTQTNYLFKLNLVFASLYVFLWLVSSFGIVWYGITMYFSFLLMIGVGVYYLSSTKDDSDEKKQIEKFIGSGIFLLLILIHFCFSIIPYLFTNLKDASYLDYKSGDVSSYSAVFRYQNDTSEILFTLNIADAKKKDFIKENIDEDLYNEYAFDKYEKFGDIVLQLKTIERDSKNRYKNEAHKSLEKLFAGISNPKEEYKNKEIIYRIGTFLRYHISENNSRIYDDTMLFEFNDYIYSDDFNISIERLKTLGAKYMLVDLNAATIDFSINHDLTNRYEKLLKTFTSNKIELIESDSICLKLGLELYEKNKDMDEFINIAGLNYDGYDSEGKVIGRMEKLVSCAQVMNEILDKKLVTEDDFNYLIPYDRYFQTNERNINTVIGIIPSSYRALFEIK